MTSLSNQTIVSVTYLNDKGLQTPFKLSEEKTDMSPKFTDNKTKEEAKRDFATSTDESKNIFSKCFNFYSQITLSEMSREMTIMKYIYIAHHLENIMKNGGEIIDIAIKIDKLFKFVNICDFYDQEYNKTTTQVFNRILYFIDRIYDYYGLLAKSSDMLFAYKNHICDMRYEHDYTKENMKNTAFYSFIDNTMEHDMNKQYVKGVIFGDEIDKNRCKLVQKFYKDPPTQRDLYFYINAIYSFAYCLNAARCHETFGMYGMRSLSNLLNDKKRDDYKRYTVASIDAKSVYESVKGKLPAISAFIEQTKKDFESKKMALKFDEEQQLEVEYNSGALLFEDWKKMNQTVYDHCYKELRELDRICKPYLKTSLLDLQNTQRKSLRMCLSDIISQIHSEETKLNELIDDGENISEIQKRRYAPLRFDGIGSFAFSFVFDLEEIIRFIDIINAEFATN